MRNAYWDAQRRLLVFWVPKSACTAVANWYARGLLGHRRLEGGPRAWLIKNHHNLRYPEALEVARRHDAHSIAFIRHPFDRLISAYLNKFVVYKDKPITRFEDLEAFAQRFYCRVKGMKPKAAAKNYEGITFLELLREIDAEVANAGGGEADLNGHINTQYPLLYRQAGFIADEIYDVASLNAILAKLNERYGGTYLPPTHSNATNYSPHSGEFIGDVPSKALAEEGILISKQGFASNESLALARRAHALDYEAFGFTVAPPWHRSEHRTAGPDLCEGVTVPV
jgi:hypothetical protein